MRSTMRSMPSRTLTGSYTTRASTRTSARACSTVAARPATWAEAVDAARRVASVCGVDLAVAGYAIGDVQGVLVTHIHPDHYGLAGRIRETSGAWIALHPADAARLRSGEVLVARTTTPAWTPLFARAAAVVTDGGTLAAHASLVAREYGIPAVVATGDATVRLRDGQVVTVDGTAGAVET